jgi:hypothetical protein
MSSRSSNAVVLLTLAAASAPAFAVVSRGTGTTTVIALANGYAISAPMPASDVAPAPYARDARHFFALPVRLAGRAIASMPGEFGAFDPPITAPLAIWSWGGSSVACTASRTSYAGAIVVIDRGSCSFSTKMRNAQAAGAAGVVIVDNQPGDPGVMGQDGTANQPTLPAVMVARSEGAAIKASQGLSVTVDGSSPAPFPIASGADVDGDPGNPMNIGGGVLNLAAAASPSATLDPALVSFPKGDAAAGRWNAIPVMVTNPTSATHTYAASIVLSAFAKGAAAPAVSISPSSLTLAPGESATLAVTVDSADPVPHWGRLVVTPDAGAALAARFWFAVRTYTDAGPLQ